MTKRDTSLNYVEEITLALALLGAVTAVVLKFNDIFNNNVISSPSLFGFNLVNSLITALLGEFFIIFGFFYNQRDFNTYRASKKEGSF